MAEIMTSPPNAVSKKRQHSVEEPLTVQASSKWICLPEGDNSTGGFHCRYCSLAYEDKAALETHYETKHDNRCGTCRSNFPSERLLELHIVETHDSYFKTVAQTKKSYKCLEADCSKLFWNDQRRKLHLVSKHGYAQSFAFHPELRGRSYRSKPCKYFQASGQCKFGENCHFLHGKGSASGSSKQRENGKGGYAEGEMTRSLRKDKVADMQDIHMKDVAEGVNKVKIPDAVHFGHKRR